MRKLGAGDLCILGVAIASGLRAFAAWRYFGAVLEPDTALYAQGGVGLFPSPLGRLVGMGGVAAVAALNVAANVVLVYAIAGVARRMGGRPWVAVLVFAATPLSWWTIFAGVDTAAAALIVGAFAWGYGLRHLWWFAAASLFHLAALLVVAAYVAVLHRAAALWLLLVGVALALATPYRSVVLDVNPRTVAASAILTALLAGLTAPFWLGRSAVLVLPALAGGALAAGLVSSGAIETNARYMLPAVAIGSAVLGGPYAVGPLMGGWRP